MLFEGKHFRGKGGIVMKQFLKCIIPSSTLKINDNVGDTLGILVSRRGARGRVSVSALLDFEARERLALELTSHT